METEQAVVSEVIDQAISREVIFASWAESMKRRIPDPVLEEIGNHPDLMILLSFMFVSPRKQCCRCTTTKERTEHHIFPKRHFGNGGTNRLKICFCKTCHEELEKILGYGPEPAIFFVQKLMEFLISKP